VSDLAAKNFLFAVRRQEVDYKAPARLGDLLRIKTEVEGDLRLQDKVQVRNRERGEKVGSFVVIVDSFCRECRFVIVK